MIDPKEIWLCHYSVKSWNSSKLWDVYLQEIEQILGDKIVKLDKNDPLRRLADIQNGEGNFVTDFKERDDTRWLFGTFKKSKISFQIQFSKNGFDSFNRIFCNSIDFYIPEKCILTLNNERIINFFNYTNQHLEAFYAYADLKSKICVKKSCGIGCVSFSTELMGIFWLTYFGSDYKKFFNKKLEDIPFLKDSLNDGVELNLAASPFEVDDGLREKIMNQIGQKSFANGSDIKRRGEFVLTLEQLRKKYEPSVE